MSTTICRGSDLDKLVLKGNRSREGKSREDGGRILISVAMVPLLYAAPSICTPTSILHNGTLTRRTVKGPPKARSRRTYEERLKKQIVVFTTALDVVICRAFYVGIK